MKQPSVTPEQIEHLLATAEVDAYTAFDKCTVVTVKLPNGFILTESSACVSPDNYNFEMGKDICLGRIKNKLWELEGYYLQKEEYIMETVVRPIVKDHLKDALTEMFSVDCKEDCSCAEGYCEAQDDGENY